MTPASALFRVLFVESPTARFAGGFDPTWVQLQLMRRECGMSVRNRQLRCDGESV